MLSHASLDVSVSSPGEQQPVPTTHGSAAPPTQEQSSGQLPHSVYHVQCAVLIDAAVHVCTWTCTHSSMLVVHCKYVIV